MDHLPRRRVLVYIVFGCLVLVGGVWGLTSSGEKAGASGVLLVQGEPAAELSGEIGTQGSPGEVTATATTQAALVYVQVAGEVRRPGVYPVAPESRVYQVLEQAGGVTEEADEQALTLAAPVTDGARIYVPRRGEVAPAGAVSSSPGGASAPGAAPGPLSLNAATQAELEALPGIGPAMAQRIIAYREENGPLQSVEELDDVSGIGPALMEQLRPLVVP
jgi:competence protein ComEA